MSTDPRLFRASASPPPPAPRMSIAQFGMRLLLASLAMLFGATVVAYFITRASLSHWSGKALGLPSGLVASTIILIGVSLAFEWSRAGIRNNRQRQLQQGLVLGGTLALGFIAAQISNWFTILSLNPDLTDRELTLFTFYMLTGVHALHVIGGFVPLAWVFYRARQREYSSSRYEGVRLCIQYWHFLGIVWLLLVLVMNLA